MTDNDTISRRAAIETLDRFNVFGYVEEPWEKLSGALQALPSAQLEIIDIAKTTMAMAKTADMVAVVRCKDCKHWCINKRLDIPWCRNSHIDRGANDFCSYAERRTDDEG